MSLYIVFADAIDVITIYAYPVVASLWGLFTLQRVQRNFFRHSRKSQSGIQGFHTDAKSKSLDSGLNPAGMTGACEGILAG